MHQGNRLQRVAVAAITVVQVAAGLLAVAGIGTAVVAAVVGLSGGHPNGVVVGGGIAAGIVGGLTMRACEHALFLVDGREIPAW